MKITTLFVLIVFQILLFSISVYSQEQYLNSYDSSLAQQLQETLDEQLETLGLTGLSAAIVFPDKSVWLGASGMSDPINNDSMRTNMIFNTCSIGKNFTATVVLQLVEEGMLSLEDPLHKWLPTFPNIDSTITVRQLLNHTSGIYHILDNPSFLPAVIADPDKYWTYEEILLNFQKEAHAKPGVRLIYSSTNYILLSWIIEKVTSSFFPIEMENRLGNLSVLDHTYFTWSDTIPEDFAHPWFDLNNDGIPDDVFDKYKIAAASVSYGSGGMLSTAENQAQWMKYLFEGGCLSQESLDQMLILEYSTNIGYGMGVMEYTRFDRNFLGHSGHAPGYTSLALYSPRDSLSIAILSNDDYSPRFNIASELLEVLYISMYKYPKLSFDDSALHLGDVPAHLSKFDTSFYVYNTGGGNDSVFASISFGSADSNAFSVVPSVFELAPDDSQEITYRIFPDLLDQNLYRTMLKLESKFSPFAHTISKSIMFNLIVTGIDEQITESPKSFKLGQNYPNPFNPSTTINYSLSKDTHVRLVIYNVLGDVVTVLFDGFQEQGTYDISWDASRYSSGLYIYRLEADGYTAIRKMVLQK